MSNLDPQEIVRLTDELYAALRTRKAVVPLTTRYPTLDIDEAYGISLGLLKRRLRDGERVIGKKIGVTSKVVQDMLDVREPDFGFLTDAMEVASGAEYRIDGNMIQPRAEAEIAFIIKDEIRGPGLDHHDVLAATAYVAPCFEIVDSRIVDWRIRIQDTVADNASCGIFVLGADRVDPRTLDLSAITVRVKKNGRDLSQGSGAAVQGSPLNAVAWLANTLGRYGMSLSPGDIILSGSLVPLEPARPADEFSMELEGVGGASIKFV